MQSKRQTIHPPCYYQSANDVMVTHALGQMTYMIYYTHPTSVGFEHSVCYELLLSSLYIYIYIYIYITNWES